jgi:saccharopine dehydrogenase (NAD+, L-lysine-forming)
MPRYMIYGATGYTGRLCIEEAKRRGHAPVIAGRHPQKMLALAEATGCEARVFDLDKPELIAPKLAGVAAVLHCAGPFSRTSAPMLAACLQARVHYLDITGEIDVFEQVFKQTERAREAGIAAIPGVGFDVVPSDCLAAMLKERLPDATRLQLAIDARRGGVSPGTAKTALEGLGSGARVREGGRIVTRAAKGKTMTVPFPSGPATALCVPWGDVATAYHSTGIPDIEVYMALPKASQKLMGLGRGVGLALKLPPLRRFVERRIERHVHGPSDEKRRRGATELWGRVVNADGKSVELALVGPEGYTLTAEAATLAVERVLAGKVASGASTPSKAFGAEFALSLHGVRLVE